VDVTISTLAERPDLQGPMWDMPDSWPEFMRHDPVGWSHYPRIPAELPEYVLVAVRDDGTVVAHAFSVPFALGGPGRGELPGTGWDRALLWAVSDARHGRPPDTVSAIEISVEPGSQGQGLSARMLDALRDNARRLGFAEVVAPVRPTAKHLEPDVPMTEYAARTRPDGLPSDPWLRVHVRAGGEIVGVAPASMVIPGTLEDWRAWTGQPFDADGPVRVPGALVPVQCVAGHGYAVYVEPKVWGRHRLD
jgi:GNAT superfamily N-acetyltransferase